MPVAYGARHATGRHRLGAALMPWVRIRWDIRQRAAAAGLDAIEPGWLVIYRVWARRFYAVPMWPLAGRPGIEADTVAGLRARMRQAETAPCPSGPPVPMGGEEVSRDGK